MTSASPAMAGNARSNTFIRTPLGELMKFEILVNEKSQVWIFHDTPFPCRLAWIEFDPVNRVLELISHDMGSKHGILCADVPPGLSARIRQASMVYLYLTDGDSVTGFQKTPIKTRVQ